MKSKFLVVIVLLVTAIHIALFVLTQRDDEGQTSAEPASPSSLPDPAENEEPPSPLPVASSPSPAEKMAAESAVTVVDDAVGIIQNSETVASTPPVSNSSPASPPLLSKSEEAPESGATMIVGLVDGKSKLPPELFEVAEEGAKAVASQDWERARELYLRMVSEAPENALGYANLGVAEHQLGNLLAAAGNLRKSLEINPSIAQNWQTLGIIRYERGELELSISALTRAIHEDPSDARSRLYLAAVIRTYGWIEASITELERAVETDPEFADAHYNLAVSYLEVDPPRTELARRHYFSAVDLGAEPSTEIEEVFRSFDENE